MFGWLKKRSWKLEVLPELQGQQNRLVVRMRNVPCLRDVAAGGRKYVYADFGHDFLMALHRAIGGVQHAHSRLIGGSIVTASVSLPQQPPILVELNGRPDESPRVFESDIADAVIDAFSAAGLRPS